MQYSAVPTISVPSPLTPGAGTPGRQGSAEKAKASPKAENAFSSVLHSVSDRQRETKPGRMNDSSRNQDDRDPGPASTTRSTSEDHAAPKEPMKTSRTDESEESAKSDQSAESSQSGGSDQIVENDGSDKTSPVTDSTGTLDTTLQALLLAVVTVPVTEPIPESIPKIAGSIDVPGQEEDPALLSEGMPSAVATVIAPAAFQTAPIDSEVEPSRAVSARTPSHVFAGALTKESVPDSDGQSANLVESNEPFTPQDVPVGGAMAPKDAVQKDEAPAPRFVPVQEPPVMPEAPHAVMPEAGAHPENLAQLQPPVREDVRQAVQARPEPLSEQIPSENRSASDEPTVTAAAWQSFSEEHQSQTGADLSEQEHRDGQGDNLFSASAGAAPGLGNAQAGYTGVASSVADSKAGAVGQPAAPTHQAPQPAAPHAVQTPDWMPAEGPNRTRSVVLEVAQADLGRVNIRVAVNQDTVHAYFTSDRSEVGQFLVNGQDKLQAALQNAGLDMGQFRVDIDRQSAGRSFQHQTPQGQDQWQEPYREGGAQGQAHESARTVSSHRPGMLNLVA